jgi:hypothetical protein
MAVERSRPAEKKQKPKASLTRPENESKERGRCLRPIGVHLLRSADLHNPHFNMSFKNHLTPEEKGKAEVQ